MFGRVVEGMATVKRMEVVGSRAGKTSRKVVIADSGQVCVDRGMDKPFGNCDCGSCLLVIN